MVSGAGSGLVYFSHHRWRRNVVNEFKYHRESSPPVCFTDANHGTVVGDSSTILHTTNGGVTSVEAEQQHEVPQQFLLTQNYPNPFNPSTTIQYSLPHRSHVTLSVFNTLGQQIAQLVNSDIEAGYHELQFNATNLASGVYFYRMQAGGYVETKKLLLVQ